MRNMRRRMNIARMLVNATPMCWIIHCRPRAAYEFTSSEMEFAYSVAPGTYGSSHEPTLVATVWADAVASPFANDAYALRD